MTELFDSSQMPFQKEREHTATRGVKLKNKRSSIAEQAKQKNELEARFNNAADSYVKNKTERQAVGFELAKRFLLSLNDKTIPANKGVIADDDERMVRSKLIELAIALNNDIYEREGEGSIAVIQLLLKGMLKLRDRLNEVEYKLHVLEKNVSSSAASEKK